MLVFKRVLLLLVCFCLEVLVRTCLFRGYGLGGQVRDMEVLEGILVAHV